MPSKIPTVCPTCRKAPCTCVRAPKKDNNRPSARQRGYTTRWDKARRGFLDKHPVCEWLYCKAPATVVDHIKPHKNDQALFWDRSNWQPLCAHHHNSAKQSHETRGRQAIGEDGRPVRRG